MHCPQEPLKADLIAYELNPDNVPERGAHVILQACISLPSPCCCHCIVSSWLELLACFTVQNLVLQNLSLPLITFPTG